MLNLQIRHVAKHIVLHPTACCATHISRRTAGQTDVYYVRYLECSVRNMQVCANTDDIQLMAEYAEQYIS